MSWRWLCFAAILLLFGTPISASVKAKMAIPAGYYRYIVFQPVAKKPVLKPHRPTAKSYDVKVHDQGDYVQDLYPPNMPWATLMLAKDGKLLTAEALPDPKDDPINVSTYDGGLMLMASTPKHTAETLYCWYVKPKTGWLVQYTEKSDAAVISNKYLDVVLITHRLCQ